MMWRDNSGLDGSDRLRRLVASLDRYDLLLAAIPVALAAAVVVGDVLGVPLETALLGGATVGALALFDGLFVRPPRGLQGT